MVVFRLACLAVLYSFLYRVCVSVADDVKASSAAVCLEEEEGDA